MNVDAGMVGVIAISSGLGRGIVISADDQCWTYIPKLKATKLYIYISYDNEAIPLPHVIQGDSELIRRWLFGVINARE